MATLFLIVIYAAFISLGLPDGLLGTAWPIMHLDYQVAEASAGIISMIISGGTIVSSLMSGRVLKRFGTGRVTAVSVTMTAIALLGFSQSPGFFWLMLLAVPLGLGAGSVDSGLNDYVAKHYAARHMNWLHCFWGIGAMSGPVLISQFMSRGDSWRNGYLTVAIIQFALVALLFFTLPVWDRVAKLTRKNVEEPETNDAPVTTAHKPLMYPLRVPGVKAALLVFLFYCGIEATMGLWGSSFLVNIKGLDAPTAAGWVSLFYGSITLGRFLSGFVTLRLTSKALIRLGQVSILAGVILLLMQLPATFSLVGMVLIGLGCAPIFPSMLHETPARFGNEDAQMIMGFQMAVAYTGSTFLPPIFGFIASNTSFMLMPFFLLTYALLILFNAERLNSFLTQKRKRGETSPELATA